MHCFYHPYKPAVAMCNMCMKALCKKCVREKSDGIVCSAKCAARLSRNRQSEGEFEAALSQNMDILNSPLFSYGISFWLFMVCGIGMLVTIFFIPKAVDILVSASVIFFILAAMIFFGWQKIKLADSPKSKGDKNE